LGVFEAVAPLDAKPFDGCGDPFASLPEFRESVQGRPKLPDKP
jgi:hypothetical protein